MVFESTERFTISILFSEIFSDINIFGGTSANFLSKQTVSKFEFSSQEYEKERESLFDSIQTGIKSDYHDTKAKILSPSSLDKPLLSDPIDFKTNIESYSTETARFNFYSSTYQIIEDTIDKYNIETNANHGKFHSNSYSDKEFGSLEDEKILTSLKGDPLLINAMSEDETKDDVEKSITYVLSSGVSSKIFEYFKRESDLITKFDASKEHTSFEETKIASKVFCSEDYLSEQLTFQAEVVFSRTFPNPEVQTNHILISSLSLEQENTSQENWKSSDYNTIYLNIGKNKASQQLTMNENDLLTHEGALSNYKTNEDIIWILTVTDEVKQSQTDYVNKTVLITKFSDDNQNFPTQSTEFNDVLKISKTKEIRSESKIKSAIAVGENHSSSKMINEESSIIYNRIRSPLFTTFLLESENIDLLNMNNNEKSNNSDIGLIAGIGVGVFVALILIVLMMYSLISKKFKHSTDSSSTNSSEIENQIELSGIDTIASENTLIIDDDLDTLLIM